MSRPDHTFIPVREVADDLLKTNISSYNRGIERASAALRDMAGQAEKSPLITDPGTPHLINALADIVDRLRLEA